MEMITTLLFESHIDYERNGLWREGVIESIRVQLVVVFIQARKVVLLLLFPNRYDASSQIKSLQLSPSTRRIIAPTHQRQ